MTYVVYCLVSDNGRRTYVGCTNNMPRRLRQHNGELSGGARATRGGRPWRILFVSVVPLDKSGALSRERIVKNKSRAKSRASMSASERRLTSALEVFGPGGVRFE